jgi:predicted dehydrogenase
VSRARVAIIGLGMAVGPHAESLRQLAGRVEVSHAFSRSNHRREMFAARFGFPVSGDLAEIEHDPSVAAVLILTPPNSHLELARRFALAGKHILVEKPLEVSTARAEALVATCRRAGVKLGVVLQHRFRAGSLRLKALLDAGELGELVSATASIRLWRPQSYYDEPGRGSRARDGGGVLLTQGIHTLDLLMSLAGPPAEVTGFATTSPVHRMETEDLVAAAVRFRSGAIGVIDATTACYPGQLERIELLTKHATAVLEGARLEVWFQDGRRVEAGADEVVAGGADPMAFPPVFHRRLVEDFLDAIDANREPAVNGEEALRVHRLIDALLLASARTEVVRLEPPPSEPPAASPRR